MWTLKQLEIIVVACLEVLSIKKCESSYFNSINTILMIGARKCQTGTADARIQDSTDTMPVGKSVKW